MIAGLKSELSGVQHDAAFDILREEDIYFILAPVCGGEWKFSTRVVKC